MRTIFNALAITGLMLSVYPYTWSQSQENRLKFEINVVMDMAITTHINKISTSNGSSTQAPRYFSPLGNWGIETGVIYELKKRHFISGRLGVFLTRSGASLHFSSPILLTSGASINNQSLVHENTSIRMEVGHQYRFYNKKKVQMSFNSGLGLRYWDWNQTSEITYYDVLVSPGDVPIGEYKSYSLRPLHPDLNLGLSLVLKDFFDHVDLSFSYSFLWAPFNAYRMDPVTFRDRSGFENQFQYDSRVNYNQFRIGFIFSPGVGDKVDEGTL